jgi:hypothetical protein
MLIKKTGSGAACLNNNNPNEEVKGGLNESNAFDGKTIADQNAKA